MTKNLLTLTVLVLALVACSPEAPRLTVSPTVAVAGEPVTVTGARFGDRAGSVSLGDEALPAASVAWHADRLVLTPSRRTPPHASSLPPGCAAPSLPTPAPCARGSPTTRRRSKRARSARP